MAMLDSDKLTSDIFSILENKFLFGENNSNKTNFRDVISTKNTIGKVCILSIDGGDPLLAAASLSRLENSLRIITSNPSASISDFFDVATGSGSGGLLASLLFTRPHISASDAQNILHENRKKLSGKNLFKQVFKREDKGLGKVFGDATLKDTSKAVLIPCYDISSGAAFVFSRSDALEMDGCDFKMSDVCAATMSKKAVEIKSVDGKNKIMALGGEVVMNNPTVAAITHVLNNKNEFPFCNGVEDLMVLSLGNGESGVCNGNVTSKRFVQIAGEGSSDLVDQAVSMTFGESRSSNYVRIQTNGATEKINKGDLLGLAEEMLAQTNIESVLFQGKRLVKSTNLEKLQMFAGELIKEQERRKTSILPTVILKNGSPSPRTSSATTLSTLSSN